jgi:hypothetical protein
MGGEEGRNVDPRINFFIRQNEDVESVPVSKPNPGRAVARKSSKSTAIGSPAVRQGWRARAA